MSKPIDYDSPRRSGAETGEDSAEELTARRTAARSLERDLDEAEVGERFELPDPDPSGEELTAPILPMQPDEFRCARCFLVHHHSQLAMQRGGQDICRECS